MQTIKLTSSSLVCVLGIYRMAQQNYAPQSAPQGSAWAVSVLSNGWGIPRGLVIAALTGDVRKATVVIDEAAESVTITRLAPWEDICVDATDALMVIGSAPPPEEISKLIAKFTSAHNPATRPDVVIAQVMNVVLGHVESLQFDNLGSELAYLCHAIATDGRVQWGSDNAAVLELFRELFVNTNPVWGYIEEVG